MDRASSLIQMQIIGNRLSSIAREMGYALIRSGRSILIRENEDCSAAILDAEYQIVAQDVHCAGHLGSIALAVKESVKATGEANLREGDVLLQNDPYLGCIHLPDFAMVAPVFYENKIVFYVANIAHHSDIGGMAAGSSSGNARELYQEGLRLPPLKIVSAGILNQAVVKIITANSRVPEERRGDLRAQMSALGIGIERITSLLNKYGPATVTSSVNDLMHHSETLIRKEIEQFPDGVYSFEDYLDNDGISTNPLKIRVSITVKGSELVYNFEGTDHQAPGSVNSPLSVTLATVYYMTRALTDWTIPVNEGCYRPISLIAPAGTVVNPLPPAAVALCSEVYPRIVDTILGAMSQCVAERVVAAPMGTNNIHIIGGANADGNPFVYYECYGGGWGGGLNYDGISGYDCFETNAKSTPVEVLETYFPFKLLETKFIPDSGGAGEFPGGRGVFRRLKVLVDCSLSLLADRFENVPFGLFGGNPGTPGKVIIRKPDGKETMLYSKASNVELHGGDEIITVTGSGGGYGEPFRRNPELVSGDLKMQKISRESAEKHYKVVLQPGSFKVNAKATQQLRANFKRDGEQVEQ